MLCKPCPSPCQQLKFASTVDYELINVNATLGTSLWCGANVVAAVRAAASGESFGGARLREGAEPQDEQDRALDAADKEIEKCRKDHVGPEGDAPIRAWGIVPGVR